MRSKTAVEWLEMEIVKLEETYAIPSKIYELCEDAKDMEKQQIMKAVDDGFEEGCKLPEDIKLNNAEQYYNENY
jgi:hypothetical protein